MWQRWDASVLLGRGTVHVIAWRLSSADIKARAYEAQVACLSAEERARADRFIFDRHRSAFVQAHAGMRRVLAAYLGCSPAALGFLSGTHGKPQLAGHWRQLHFNLSHTEGQCALAVCAMEDEVGVDAERIRPMEPLVARSHFSQAEQAQLATLSGDAWKRAFFRCWTSKEALLKAEGVGLQVPLDSFDVTLLPQEPAALIAHRQEARFTRPWRLSTFSPGEGVAGAVAMSGDLAPVLLQMTDLETALL